MATVLDRVHEHILIPPVVLRCLDTPQVQRLRGLKQLGASSYLYPGAVHSRFEHSVGVAHLARTFLTILQQKQPDLGITKRNIENAMLAGLCHDIGHGPFSHLFEDVITRRCATSTKKFCHETMSQLLARKALKQLISTDDLDEVLRLMNGDPRHKLPHGELISNKRNGIDVDRLDYFVRDSMCCFGKPTVDVRLQRLFHSAMVMRLANNEFCLAFEEKMVLSIRELFALRAKLHKQVYQHHTTKAIGHMIGDAFALAEPYFKVHGRTMSECCDNEDLFLALGDWILEAIEFDSNKKLKEAQSIIRRLRCRDIYKLISTHTLAHGVAIEAADVSAKLLCEERGLLPDDFVVDIVVINHGKGMTDPLRHVPFYNPKVCAGAATMIPNLDGGSLFSPSVFEERCVMIFHRSGVRREVLKRAASRWAQWATASNLFAPHIPFCNASQQ